MRGRWRTWRMAGPIPLRWMAAVGAAAIWTMSATAMSPQAPAGGQAPSGGERGGAAPTQGQGRGGPGQAAGRAQGRGRGGPQVVPLPFSDHEGFQAIFDGTSMNGWDGDPTYWRAEGGALVGETTPEHKLERNTFLVWRGGQPRDFELKLEYRMNSTNSGIQYRSVELTDVGKWVLKGYQADIDFANQYTGQLYEERGRGFLAMRGQIALKRESDERSRAIGALESGDALKGYIKSNDWNEVHIIARGNTLIHIINGHVMAVFVDEDAKNAAAGGLLGFQIHVGEPMKVEFRNIYLKTL